MIRSSPANPFADDHGSIAVRIGDRLPGIPRHSAAFAIDCSGDTDDGRRFALVADALVRSSQVLVGDEANLNKPVPGYATVNLQGSIELMPGLSLTGELRNALGRDYATFGPSAKSMK